MQYSRLSDEENDTLLHEHGVPNSAADVDDHQPAGESHSDSTAAEVQAAALQALSTHEALLAECTLFKEVCAACDPQDELVKDLHASLARGQAALHDQISLAQGEGEVVDLLAINDVVEATLAVYQQRVEESVMMADTRNETEEEQQQQQLEAAAASTTSLVVGVPVSVEAPSVVEAPASAASFEDQLIDLLGAPAAAAAAPAPALAPAAPASASAFASVPSKSDAQLDAEANNLLAEFDSLIGEMGGDAGNNTQEVVAQPVTSASTTRAPRRLPSLVKTSSEQEFDAFFTEGTAAAATSPHGPNMVASAV